MKQSPWSASVALMILVFCAMCMFLGITGHGAWQAWQREVAATEQKVLAVARSYQVQQRILTTATEVLLNTLSLAPVVRAGQGEALSTFMRELDVALPDYLGFAVFNSRGEALASVAGGNNFPPLPPASVRERAYFVQAWKTRSFSVGHSVITHNEPLRVFLPMSMPILGEHDRILGVIMAPLDMSRYDLALGSSTMEYLRENDISVRLLDAQGRIMYQFPHDMRPATGSLFSSPCLVQAQNFRGDTFSRLARGADTENQTCLVLKMRMEASQEPYMYIMVQTPRLTLGRFLDTHYFRELLAMGGALLFALLVAAVAGRRFFGRGLERLVMVTRETQAGRTDVRNGPLQGCREIQVLGQGMDAMLDALQRSSNLLREQRIRLEMALDAAQMGIWTWYGGERLELDARGWESLGYDIEILEDSNLLTVFYPEDVADLMHCMEEHHAGATAQFRHEARVRNRSGDLVWLLFVGRLVGPVQMGAHVQGVCSDITARRRVEELEREKAEHYRQLSTVDGLTGLVNRRRFDELALSEIERCLRYGHPLTLIMADVDHFKKVNDTYGHAAGDEVLRRFAQAMHGMVRATDTVARYGGEEFVLLLPETDLAAGCVMAEKIRMTCAGLTVHYGNTQIHFTASFGVCACTLQGQAYGDARAELERMLQHADEAMYASKTGGRNRVTAHNTAQA